MVADVHVALDDPAAEPKRQVILDLRLDGAGLQPANEINEIRCLTLLSAPIDTKGHLAAVPNWHS
jgi:hypothetical protein